MVPEMEKALHVFSSIPATSCSSERSFSALRRIKNYVRNRIGQERLNNVSVLNIERLYANEVLKYDLRKGEQVCPLLSLTVMPASNVIAPTSQLSAALQNNHILCLV